jgi:hypothetical protein
MPRVNGQASSKPSLETGCFRGASIALIAKGRVLQDLRCLKLRDTAGQDSPGVVAY